MCDISDLLKYALLLVSVPVSLSRLDIDFCSAATLQKRADRN